MNAKQVGLFMQELRKEKGITQKELAEALHVSNKTISRWETGKGYPEVSLMKSISDYFEITVTELLSGCRLSTAEYKEQSEDILVTSLSKNSKRHVLEYILYTIIALFLIAYIGLMTGDYNTSLEVLVVFVSILITADQIKKKRVKILIIILIFSMFVIVGGITIRKDQYQIGKELGYSLGVELNKLDTINSTNVVYKYADIICPYEYGTSEWKGFMMGFQDGFTENEY